MEPERAEGTPVARDRFRRLRRKQGHAFDLGQQRQPDRAGARLGKSVPGRTADCASERLDWLRGRLHQPHGRPGWAAHITGQALINLGVACGNNPDPFRTAFPGYSNITKLYDQANSVYHALQLGAQRTVGDLTVSAAYTYSHSIDDSSDRGDTAFVNAYNIAANRASSTFDMRHNLTVSYVYGLPFFKASGLTHTLLGGWQLSGITIAQAGLPFSVTNGTTYGDSAGVGNGVGTGSRPDLVGNPRASIPQTEFPSVRGPVIFNPAAFAAPTGLTFGTVGRNTLNYPGRLNFDAGLSKRFAITERMGFDFKWEMFNLFNHTQFDQIDNQSLGANAIPLDTFTPGTNLNSSSFLHLTGAHEPRRMQFGLRFYF